MGQRIVIVSGGNLGNWALAHIQEGDILIGADRGALFLVEHGLRPQLALGDFDSISAEEMAFVRAGSDSFENCDPVDKDLTDTEMAFVRALSRRAGEIVLLGAVGTRFDHTLANVHLLRRALQHGVSCTIVDESNRIRLTDSALIVKPSEYTHVSLLPLSERVTGISLEGFAYPLQDAELVIGQTLGISNVLSAERGVVTVKTGLLLVIESRD